MNTLAVIIVSIYAYSWLLLITRRINSVRDMDKMLVEKLDLESRIIVEQFPFLIPLAKILGSIAAFATAPVLLIESAMNSEIVEREEFIEKIQKKK